MDGMQFRYSPIPVTTLSIWKDAATGILLMAAIVLLTLTIAILADQSGTPLGASIDGWSDLGG